MRGRRLEPEPERDWSNRPGAEALAAEISKFWLGFGHDVRVWVEPGRGGRNPLWIVKSTLRAGLPRSDTGEPLASKATL
jgi:hypothetical protein